VIAILRLALRGTCARSPVCPWPAVDAVRCVRMALRLLLFAV
jgi:hypothetical protein